jgi:hypothetical protein
MRPYPRGLELLARDDGLGVLSVVSGLGGGLGI